MPFNRRRSLTATVLALAATSATLHHNAFAQTDPTPPVAPPTTTTPAATTASIDEAAKTTLTQMLTTQQALNSYSANVAMTAAQGEKTQTSNADITYSKPNKAVVHATSGTDTITVISDGKSSYAVTSPTAYIKGPAAAGADNIATAISTGHATALGIMPLILNQSDPAKIVLQGATAVAKLPDETLDGVATDVVSVTTGRPGGQSFTATFAAGKDDHLIRRVVITAGASTKITEAYTNVKANPTIAADAFVFTPKPGMKESVPPPEAPEYDPRIKVGAKPISFSGTDTSGKVQNLAAYKGKVVLLDFWATWCPPCRAEMPNVVAAYNKFHGQGFNIVGISLDQADAKAKLASFTKDNKMPWPQIYDGKEWKSAIAQLYGVQAIPFSVLIGKDGKILAVNPRGEALEPAIKAALAK